MTRRESDVADEIIFSVADQINHGIDDYSSAQSPELRTDLAKLYGMAGAKAVDRSDFVTARSYLNTALSLVPTDHWKSHYDLSRRLYFLTAQSANSCGDVDKAQCTLQEILSKCHSIDDKLPSYYLRAASKCQLTPHNVCFFYITESPTPSFATFLVQQACNEDRCV